MQIGEHIYLSKMSGFGGKEVPRILQLGTIDTYF